MNDMTTQEAVAPAAIAADEPASDNRKKLLIVGGAVLALLLVVGAFLVLRGGGGEEDLGAVPSAAKKVTAGDQPAGTGADAPAEAPADAAPVGEYTDNLGRDPFTPLYPAPVEQAPADEATTGGSVTTDTGGGTITTDPTVTTGTPVNLVLEDVSAAAVTFTVDGSPVSAKADGTPFNGTLRVYGVFSDSCAGIMNGEDSFVMCEGDSRSVTV